MLHSFKNDHARVHVDIFKLARDDGVGRSRLPRRISNTMCAGDEGIPGRAWLRCCVRSKMIMLGFLLIFSSLPGMTGLGEVAFQGEYLIGFVQAMTGSRVAPGFGVAFVQK